MKQRWKRFFNMLMVLGLFVSTQPGFADSGYTCSACQDYNWRDASGRNRGYAYSKFKIYYNGSLYEESRQFETPGKCLFSREFNVNCPSEHTHKFTCSRTCVNNYTTWSNGARTYSQSFFIVYYGTKFYEKKYFDTPGKCQAELETSYLCK